MKLNFINALLLYVQAYIRGKFLAQAYIREISSLSVC